MNITLQIEFNLNQINYTIIKNGNEKEEIQINNLNILFKTNNYKICLTNEEIIKEKGYMREFPNSCFPQMDL